MIEEKNVERREMLGRKERREGGKMGKRKKGGGKYGGREERWEEGRREGEGRKGGMEEGKKEYVEIEGNEEGKCCERMKKKIKFGNNRKEKN